MLSYAVSERPRNLQLLSFALCLITSFSILPDASTESALLIEMRMPVARWQTGLNMSSLHIHVQQLIGDWL